MVGCNCKMHARRLAAFVLYSGRRLSAALVLASWVAPSSRPSGPSYPLHPILIHKLCIMSVANGGPLATTSGGMKPVQIAQVKGNSRENRTAAHSHIKGLGLRSDGRADTNAQGFVGQVAAREVGPI
jgi:hypothetical protein